MGVRRAAVLGCWAFALGLAFAAAGARAQNTSSLSWVRLPGAETCIATQALAERVEQRLGRQVFVSASQADLSLEGHVERTPAPGGFTATIVVSDRDGAVLGQRVLRVAGDDCSALEASLVLVIAIAVDPGASSAALIGKERALSEEAKAMLEQLELPKLSEADLIAELTAQRPGAGPEPGPAEGEWIGADGGGESQQAGKPPAVEAELRPRVELRLFAGVAVEVGVLPGAGFGATLGVTITSGWVWPIDLWLEGLLQQQHAALEGPGAGEFGFLGGGFGLCPPLPASATWLPRVCGGLRGGALTARGERFLASRTNDGPWLEPTVYGGVWLRLAPLSLHATLGAGVPLFRDRFRYEDALGQPQTLHRASPVVARLELGAGAHF